MNGVKDKARRSAGRRAVAPPRPPKVRLAQRAQAMQGLALASARAGEMAQRAGGPPVVDLAVGPLADQALSPPGAPVPLVATAPLVAPAQEAPPQPAAALEALPVQGATARRPGRLLALDGLRGIGIGAVVAYHLNPSWLPGGYLGVDVFFVVSGFLITGILLDLLAGPGHLGAKLRSFWSRRARRLVPALVVACLLIALAAAAFAHDAIPRLRADIPAALGFVANSRLPLHPDSSSELTGRPPLLLPLWSLGVEEQFYLIWPWVVLAVVRFTRQPARALSRVAGAGALASALAMAIFFVPGHDPSNVYYNTFTHSAGLMAGAALVAGLRARQSRPTSRPAGPPTQGLPRRARGDRLALPAGVGALLALAGDQATFTYRGGIFLASVLVGLAIWASLRPGLPARLLSLAPLRYLGDRSYSLYIWHWPVIVLTRPNLDVPISGAPLLVARLALMGALAEGSYRFVEQPFRTGRAQAALRGLRLPAKAGAVASAGLAGAAAVTLLAVVNPAPLPATLAQGSTPAARVALPSVPAPASATAAEHRSQAAGSGPTTRSPAPAPGAPYPLASSPPATLVSQPAAPPPVPTRTLAHGTVATTTPAQGPAPTATPLAPPASAPPASAASASPLGHDVLAIGDSVLLAASAALAARLHGDITVDAAVGRQCWTGVARLAQYRAAGDLAGLKAIVIDLGTNGPLTPADVSELRQLAAGVPLLVFVNVRVDRPWQAESNASIQAVAGQPGIRVVNWYSASAAPGLLWPDGIHPDPKGAAVYADLVAAALGDSA